MSPRSFEDLAKLGEHRVALQQPRFVVCSSGTAVARVSARAGAADLP